MKSTFVLVSLIAALPAFGSFRPGRNQAGDYVFSLYPPGYPAAVFCGDVQDRKHYGPENGLSKEGSLDSRTYLDKAGRNCNDNRNTEVTFSLHGPGTQRYVNFEPFSIFSFEMRCPTIGAIDGEYVGSLGPWLVGTSSGTFVKQGTSGTVRCHAKLWTGINRLRYLRADPVTIRVGRRS